MKTHNTPAPLRLCASLCLLLGLVLGTTGCLNTPANIEAGASRLTVSNAMGKSVDVVLPKNLDAENLQVVVNPATGEYMLSADKFRTDASTVIDSGAKASADALGKMADVIKEVVPLVAPQPAAVKTQ